VDDLSKQLASDKSKESNLGVLGLEIVVATNFWIYIVIKELLKHFHYWVCSVRGAPSCCNQQIRSSSFKNEINCIKISCYFSAVTVSEKNIGPTIRLWDIAHQQQIFWECSGTSWNKWGFSLLQNLEFCEFTYPLKSKHASWKKKSILKYIYTISYKLSEPSAVTHPFLFNNLF
jgi:hypothetical protein